MTSTPSQPEPGQPAYGLEQCRDDLVDLRGEHRHAVTALLGVGGIVDGWRGTNIRAAVDRLIDLIDIPHRRPDAWEAAHVSALDEQLSEILKLLGAS